MAHRYEFSPERFCTALEQSGKSREQLARELGCSTALLGLYCIGYRQPPPPRLVALALELNVNVEDFFTEVGEDDAPRVPVVPYPSSKAVRQ